MQIENLRIERAHSYSTPNTNPLVGTVQLQGARGKMEVQLSNKTVSAIFALISADVQATAAYNASQAQHAVDEAMNEALLIESQQVPGLE